MKSFVCSFFAPRSLHLSISILEDGGVAPEDAPAFSAAGLRLVAVDMQKGAIVWSLEPTLSLNGLPEEASEKPISRVGGCMGDRMSELVS